jgi:uncharacterized protein with NRDE domain
MCLVVLAHRMHPHYRLVVAANRDEFHARDSAALGWWSDRPGILAGRDLVAGGTWFGVADNGRFAVVTNFREFERSVGADAPSRGGLVPGFLSDTRAAADHLAAIGPDAARYAGYSLLADDGTSLWYASNRGTGDRTELGPGVYGLANDRLDQPWPKVVASRARLERALAREALDTTELFDLLADREPAADVDAGPLDVELARALSATFVRHPRYGTRCSTVLLAGRDGRTVVAERRYDAEGRLTGATRHEFLARGPRG